MVAYLSQQDLLNEIRTTFAVAIDPVYATRAAANDVYEAFIACLITQAAREAGAMPPTFRNPNGSLATSLVFRTSPGSINQGSFTYALIEFPNAKPLEVHVGIYIAEKSQRRAECDVCVLHRSEANQFRNPPIRRGRGRNRRKRWPEGSRVEFFIECKYLTNNLGAFSTREFMGKCWGLGAKRFHLVTNTESITAGLRIKTGPGEFVFQEEILPTLLISSVERFKGVLRNEFRDYQREPKNWLR